MSIPIQLCKNGCDKPTYRDRSICRQCHNKENRIRWQTNKKYYNKYRLKPKHKVNCKYCKREFETARPNQKFCSNSKCQYKYHYKNRDFMELSRAKAIHKLYDKNKKRTGGYEYTPKEIKFIIKKYNKISAIDIAKQLDRPVAGVRWKIRQLKDNMEIMPKSAL